MLAVKCWRKMAQSSCWCLLLLLGRGFTVNLGFGGWKADEAGVVDLFGSKMRGVVTESGAANREEVYGKNATLSGEQHMQPKMHASERQRQQSN